MTFKPHSRGTPELTEELRKKYAYDPATGIVTFLQKSGGANIGDVCVSKSCRGYLRLKHKGMDLRAHRVVWAIYYGVWPIMALDHINRVRDDNRIANLREATAAENNANSSRVVKLKPIKGGVYFLRTGKTSPWISQDYRGKRIGHFRTKDEATAVRLATFPTPTLSDGRTVLDI
jgi:hypothetical protein